MTAERFPGFVEVTSAGFYAAIGPQNVGPSAGREFSTWKHLGAVNRIVGYSMPGYLTPGDPKRYWLKAGSADATNAATFEASQVAAALLVEVVPALEEWSYPQMQELYRNRHTCWVECSHSFLWQALEVLPPIYRGHGFLVSEAWDHNANGQALYAGFCEYKDRNFCRYSTAETFADKCELLRRAVDAGTV